jgi:hypothetical protein
MPLVPWSQHKVYCDWDNPKAYMCDCGAYQRAFPREYWRGRKEWQAVMEGIHRDFTWLRKWSGNKLTVARKRKHNLNYKSRQAWRKTRWINPEYADMKTKELWS